MYLPLTALLGLWLAAPSVAIRVVDGGDAGTTPAVREQLHGLLALRMLDKGMAVTAFGVPADVVLELRVFTDRFALRADARGTHTSQVSRSDPGTAELALSHAAVLAIAAVAPPDEPPGHVPPRTLALEIRGTNLSAAADALRLSLVGQFLTRGWTLTAERSAARPTLCIHDADELVTVAYGPPGRPCGAPVYFARRADALDDVAAREQIVGAAVALAEQPEPPAPPPPPPRLPEETVADEAREAFGPPFVAPPEPPAPAPMRLALELRASTGLALRAGLFERAPRVVDPALRLGLRIGRAPGLAGQLAGVLLPSRDGRSHRVLDGFVGAGLAYSWRLRGRWEIELDSLVGAHMHVLRAPMGGELKTIPWGELSLVGAWRHPRGWAIHAGLHPAGSWTSGWVYYVDDGDKSGSVRRFQRSGWSMTFSVGISHGWRLR